MGKIDDLDRTVINNIDEDLDKTLDAQVATNSQIEATIKVEQHDSNVENPIDVTLVVNEDHSQTVTIRQEPVSYQQQTVFSTDLEATVQDDSSITTVGSATTLTGDNEDTTVAMSGGATDIDQTIIDNEHSDTTHVQPVDVNNDKILVDAGTADRTLVENNSLGDSKTISDSRAAIVGANVNIGGGSLSLNVRPRSINSSLSETVAGIGKDELGSFSDYELTEKLGEGGMGVVYSARQSSIDRSIALKMIKGDMATEDAKNKFLIEAVVTGDLDHPNIVPVHDLGVDDRGNIFYAMKQVGGVEWHKAIKEKEIEENVDILLRVCDAIAFAHSRGVIHRDLKPENIMLGSFGEVLVMDWGLALAVSDKAKAEAIGPHTGIAGTPAYLAPEMARTGAWKMLGIWSDVYLLGAILFEIVQGKRPHTGKNVRDCLRNAAKNNIVEVKNKCELTKVALKAMATNPVDRYQNVREFQDAIKECKTHFESIALSYQAAADLATAKESKCYNDFSTAYFGYKKASDIWSGNVAAVTGEKNALLAHAELAYENGDFDLGLSLMLYDDVEFQEIRKKLVVGKENREKHQRRFKLLTRGVIALGAIVLVVSVVAAIWIQAERAIAIEQREVAIKQEKIAVEQREEAKRQEKIAVEQREEAKRQEKIAIEKGDEARKQAEIARLERAEAQRQEKIAQDQRKIAESEREEAKRQETIALEQKAKAEEQESIAIREREEAERQEKIAVKQKSIAEAETVRANKQTEIAKKAQAVAEVEREKAEKSEAKAIDAIKDMVKAQTQEQLEIAKRRAAELTAKETQEELKSRDELKKNEWWVFDSTEAKQMQQEAAKKYNLPVEKDINLAQDNEMKFRLIPAGTFGMGSKEDELGRSSEEYLHRVKISKPYYIAETELTLKQWIALTGKKADGEGEYPVWNLSYNEIVDEIIPAMQKKVPAGWRIALPSEAQWEWAARAGKNTQYHTGTGKEAAKQAGVTGAELLTSAKSVKTRIPNAWGLYDMIGNVAEWCADAYLREAYLAREKLVTDPLTTVEGDKHHVVRGGAWSNLPEHCRLGYRSYANKKSKYNFLGVRLMLIPDIKE